MIAMVRAASVDPDPRVEREAASLTDAGWDVEVLAWARNGTEPAYDELSTSTPVPVTRYSREAKHGSGMRNLVALLGFQFFIAKSLWARRKTLQAIHACDLSTGLTSALMAKVVRVPLVYDVFDYYADSFPVPVRLRKAVCWVETRVLQSADLVVLTTESRVAQVRPAVPKQMIIVHNSPLARPTARATNAVASAPRKAVRRQTFVYVGVLVPGRLIEEVCEVISRHLEWTLRIGGFGPLEGRVRAYADEFENIQWLGQMSHSAAMDVMSDSDVMFATYDPAVPNHKYSSPNKFYESLMLGKPLIVVDGTGVDALVSRHRSGLVIEYSASSFEDAAQELLSGETSQIADAAEMFKMFESEYAWEIMDDRLVDAYQTILREGPRQS